jgi:F0F1-type ATP synthase alpha subunit
VTKTPPTLDELTQLLIQFRDARDWRQFHSLKNLMVSLSLEASELLELVQWKSDEEVEARMTALREGVETLAKDVLDGIRKEKALSDTLRDQLKAAIDAFAKTFA